MLAKASTALNNKAKRAENYPIKKVQPLHMSQHQYEWETNFFLPTNYVPIRPFIIAPICPPTTNGASENIPCPGGGA